MMDTHQTRGIATRMIVKAGILRMAVIGNVCSLDSENVKTGDIFLPLDHCNINSSNVNHGPNVDKWGKRFYDCSSVYDLNMVKTFAKLAKKVTDKKPHQSRLLYMSHIKPFAGLAEKRYGDAFEKLIKSDAKGVTNDGYGEVMMLRQMDFDSTHKAIYIGIVGHQAVKDGGKYEADIFNVEEY